MNSQSPIYSLKFTITWIFVYGIIVIVLWQFIQIFLAIYIGLWLLNLIIEIVERNNSGFAFPSQSLYVESFPNDKPEIFNPKSNI